MRPFPPRAFGGSTELAEVREAVKKIQARQEASGGPFDEGNGPAFWDYPVSHSKQQKQKLAA
jgi:hypothetical protein